MFEWIKKHRLENVKNLLSVNREWDFTAVLHSLAEIGYHIEYGLLGERRSNGACKLLPRRGKTGRAKFATTR